MGFTTDLQRIHNGFTTGLHLREKFSQNIIEACINFEDGFWDGFHTLLKDNEHIVIAIENNEIIVTRAFFRVFQAYRTR